MASGRKKRQAELDQQASMAGQTAQNAAAAQMQPTPEQAAVSARNLRILNHTGDWSASSDVNWAPGMLAMSKKHMNAGNRGAYDWGRNVANPTALALAGQQEDARSAEMDSLNFENAVNQAKASATGDALQSAALTAQRYGSVISPMSNYAGNMYGQATQFASQPGFLSQAALGLISGFAGSFNPMSLFGGGRRPSYGGGGI